MSTEGEFSGERILLRQPEVIRRLQASEIGSAEAVTFLTTWLDQEAGRIERGEISQLRHNIELAEAYRDSGWTKEALYQFDQCVDQARNEGAGEEYDYCEAEVLKLRDSMP